MSEASEWTPTTGSFEAAAQWIGNTRRRPGTGSIFAAERDAFQRAIGLDAVQDDDGLPPAMLLAYGSRPPVDGSEPMRLAIMELPLPGENLLGYSHISRLKRSIARTERLAVDETIVAISELKSSRLGVGHFVTWVWMYTDESGTLCAEDQFVSFRYQTN